VSGTGYRPGDRFDSGTAGYGETAVTGTGAGYPADTTSSTEYAAGTTSYTEYAATGTGTPVVVEEEYIVENPEARR
jgi:hypothetical protein